VKQQIRISEEVQSILWCRFVNQETKTIGELCCLNIGVCSTARSIYLNWISSLKNMVLIDWSIKQLLPRKQQPCNALPMELPEKSKTFLLTVFHLVFCRGFAGHRPNLFWNDRNNLSQSGHNAIFSHTKMSKVKKCPKSFKLFWKNKQNVSAKINLGFNSLHD